MNQITVIHPYKWEGMWVFDDDRVGLSREPFVAGADTIIDHALEANSILDGESGFRLTFSAGPFPGFDYRFERSRDGDGGTWYHSENFGMEGWLCPALFRYFDDAPEELYTKFEPRN